MTDNVAAQGEHDPRIVHVASELVVDLGPQAENEGNVEYITDVIAAVDYANEQCGMDYEQGRADERARIRTGVTPLPPWVYVDNEVLRVIDNEEENP